jgi:phospholipid/cholesterol/gamma-HCH transport system substrate-binding protein
MRRRHRRGMSNLAAGIVAALVIAAAIYLAFGGPTPFAASPFVLKAVFTTETQLHIPSPVRIAGVDVGQVTSVRPLGGNSRAAVVTMDINSDGLPIHADATAGILTRIFLEGNFYVDLHPGTPNAPILSSGATLPAASTSGPVQLDRVLAALTSDARGNLPLRARASGA